MDSALCAALEVPTDIWPEIHNSTGNPSALTRDFRAARRIPITVCSGSAGGALGSGLYSRRCGQVHLRTDPHASQHRTQAVQEPSPFGDHRGLGDGDGSYTYASKAALLSPAPPFSGYGWDEMIGDSPRSSACGFSVPSTMGSYSCRAHGLALLIGTRARPGFLPASRVEPLVRTWRGPCSKGSRFRTPRSSPPCKRTTVNHVFAHVDGGASAMICSCSFRRTYWVLSFAGPSI